MGRVPARLAARIDRLSRTAHRFHRFAHHPLCREYGGEVVQLGRRNRICRGCLFVAIGGFTGLIASVFLQAPLSTVWLLGAGGLVALLAAVLQRSPLQRSTVRRSTGFARSPKVASRFLPALLIAFALGRAVQSGVGGRVLAALSCAPLAGVVAIYRRRGPDRTPCSSCAERNLATPCRGIAPIVRRERAFRRLAGQWLARAG